MKTLVGAIFICAIFGMLIVYPMYFYALNQFKRKLIELNQEAWGRLPKRYSNLGVQSAYQALQVSRNGHIGDVQLCAEVMAARSRAARLLYVGITLFMIVLGIGLTESVISR